MCQEHRVRDILFQMIGVIPDKDITSICFYCVSKPGEMKASGKILLHVIESFLCACIKQLHI
jgi:hypothetical protein